ncbi:MAG: glycosyltransferase family protein [Bacteroidota bacterium]|nr:glycosyltransferase family protein [Bacteroidota bacterium]
MKFLFVVQGEGRGHLTEAVSLYELLRDNGHEVSRVLIGRNNRRILPEFISQRIAPPVETFESPDFLVDKSGKSLRIAASLIYNLGICRRFFKSIAFLRKTIQNDKPDVVINFYELLCGLTYFVYRPQTPCVCLGHHLIMQHPDFHFPTERKIEKFLLKLNTRLTCIGAQKLLALSYKKWPDVPDRKLYILPPLLRKEILNMQPETGSFLLVYLLNPGYIDEIISWHKDYPDVIVHCFCDSPPQFKYPGLTFHVINDRLFEEYLRTCSGFITSAGFEALCEALYLDKPVMMVPTGHHYEQFCNAYAASKNGLCLSEKKFNISSFLNYMKNPCPDREKYKSWIHSFQSEFQKHLAEISNFKS